MTAVIPSSQDITLTKDIFDSSTPYSFRILIARLAVFPVPNTASTINTYIILVNKNYFF